MKLSIITKKYNKDGEPLTGFTIIELVISIFILAIAVIGIFSAFSVVVILTSNSADRLTGTYLAQEGMEIIRNIRDTNWLKMDSEESVSTTWLDGFDACLQGCEADYTYTALFPWVGKYLDINEKGFYVYDAAASAPTKFKRKIFVVPIDSIDYAVKVYIQVSWDEKPNILSPKRILAGSPDPSDPNNPYKCNPANCIKAEMTLYNWYNYTVNEEEEPAPE